MKYAVCPRLNSKQIVELVFKFGFLTESSSSSHNLQKYMFQTLNMVVFTYFKTIPILEILKCKSMCVFKWM